MEHEAIELTKENLPKENYGRFFLRSSLAIECLEELAGIDPSNEELVDTMYDNLEKYRKLKKQVSIEEEKLVNEIMDVIFMLGKDNFIFYNDGYIEHDCYSNEKDV